MERSLIPICLFPQRISPLSSEVYKAAKASFLKSETTDFRKNSKMKAMLVKIW